jgi:RNA polymerase sigma factor (sigma-70 family)
MSEFEEIERKPRKDVRIEIKVRNNLILSKMEKMGIASVSELCRQMGQPSLQSPLGELISMKAPARKTRSGEWTSLALKLAEFFRCMPEDLFSEPQQQGKLEKNTVHTEISYTEISQIASQVPTPQLAVQASDLRRSITQALLSLSAREERILRLRFGFGCEELTLQDVADLFGVNPERVRQIEAKSLRKLRHPSRFKPLVSAGAKDPETLGAL